ncbi:MAG: tetratricopeptide repeat protein [Bacteroidota bacterium]|nr:tetratricopeptide repeat protein [Bacteroidota bacterium]
MEETIRLKQIREMLEMEPNDDFLNYALALELEASGNLKEAISQLQSLLNRNPEYLGAYYKLGKLFEESKEESKAIEIYKNGLVLAQKQNNKKAAGELSEVIWMLED